MKNAFEQIVQPAIEQIESVYNNVKGNENGRNKQQPLQKIGYNFARARFKPQGSVAHSLLLCPPKIKKFVCLFSTPSFS